MQKIYLFCGWDSKEVMSWEMTDWQIGTIIAVVAVFEMNELSKAVTSMNPSIILE